MLLMGKPVCNVSTLAIASARFDLNLFRSNAPGLGMVTALAEPLPLPSPATFSAETNASASLASLSARYSLMRALPSSVFCSTRGGLALGLGLITSTMGDSLSLVCFEMWNFRRPGIALALRAIFEHSLADNAPYGPHTSVVVRCQARANGQVCGGSARVQRQALPSSETLRGSAANQT